MNESLGSACEHQQVLLLGHIVYFSDLLNQLIPIERVVGPQQFREDLTLVLQALSGLMNIRRGLTRRHLLLLGLRAASHEVPCCLKEEVVNGSGRS